MKKFEIHQYFQLDPVATKEILSCNPDIIMKALEASSTLSLLPFEITTNQENVDFNNKNRIRHDTNDHSFVVKIIHNVLKSFIFFSN